MPLPPAPTKRAALLSPDAFRATAKSRMEDPQTEETLEEASLAALPADGIPTPRKTTRSTARGAAGGAGRKRSASAPAAEPAPAPVAAAPAPAAADSTSRRGAKRPAAAPATAPAPVQPTVPQTLRETVPARAAAPTPEAAARPRKGRGTGPTKMFVLDTNVLLHDPTSLFRFEEHDIFLPMIVLEELDGHKKGMTEVARNGRQASRTLDQLAATQGADIARGLKLDATGQRAAGGCLYFQTEPLDYHLPTSLPVGKADNQILGVVEALRQKYAPREVVLVSKDINMRVKARALGLNAEDYQNDKALEDGDLLYSGVLALPADFWTKTGKNVESWQSGAHTYYRIGGPIVPQLMINQFVYFEAPGEPSLFARVTEIRDKTAVLQTLKDYGSAKNTVWGVNTRNREQNFAMNLLMDPEVDFVTLTGTAGTGKTLMALAAGLTQVLDERRYTEIIMTRATVSVGEDIGFLPGTEEEKMGPWMGALDDNLEFLAKGDGGNAGEWGRAATNELIRSRIKIKSMNFMRGRTFLNKYVIIDEAQNLTPKQMKTLITRAGPGTKIICMGNLAQIDTPYLTEGSSGLTYAVDRFKGWPHSGHITLARGERSRLADFASEVL
ncbi:PhoH family protein [Paracidovorax avenae]|uniref:PhoH family protein n=1 Tax=Paracidovorax avenae TaxID=80867 RepID=UPI000D218F49|nr:PhoH family protein [Paracidovorax avenae]AVT12215.1 phosphate starvation-inducible protein PhoH [Paracidovorax avenae]